MTPYDPNIVASSTAIVGQAGSYLYTTVWGFMPILLTIVIPLALLYAGWRMVKGKAQIR